MSRRYPKLGAILEQGLFWSWNMIFFVFVALGLFPWALVSMIQEAIKGRMPWDFTVFILLILIIPFASVFAGVVLNRRGNGGLLRLFYGLQAPLLFLCLARLFLVREINPGVMHVLLTGCVALTAYAYELFHGANHRSRASATLQLVAQACVLCVGLYAASLLVFYAVPLMWWIALTLFSPSFWLGLLNVIVSTQGVGVFYLLIGGALFFYSASLFAGLPVALVTLYWQSWRRMYRAYGARFGAARGWAITAMTVAASVILFVYCNRQPQQDVFALFDSPPKSDAERRALSQKSATIRAGLVNAYLAPYRYVSAVGENNHIVGMYHSSFGLSIALGEHIQRLYNAIAQPLLYDGRYMPADQGRAESLYEQFFDQPMQKAEQAAILNAINATYDRDQAEAGMLNREQRKVWLVQQEIEVEELGDWAAIDVHEVYENRTLEPQEVFYYFTLPSTAVITGLWLGESNDRAQGYRFVVAPRGAAQEVYRNQVRVREDPSLLEQIGPRQYRLRAFPIPARDDALRDASRMHLWMTYKVMVHDGAWPLPALVERRNVYWDSATLRSINGQSGSHCGDQWMCASAPASDRAVPAAHETILWEGYVVRATPFVSQRANLPTGRTIAVVLDRSASMARHAPAVEETFDWLRQEIANSNDLDVFLTSAQSRGETAVIQNVTNFDARQVLYFGAQKTADLLRQFAELRADRHYDAVVVVTDDGGFDFADAREQSIVLNAPLWMVHLGDRLPAGYDDAVLEAIQKHGGGVTSQVKDALESIVLQESDGDRVVDGYRWSIEPTTLSAGYAGDFDQIAVRQLLDARMRAGNLEERATLDSLQEIATRHEIVSPYSSMIVLVNEQQRQALRAAAERADRFERETESGKEILSRPSNPFTGHSVAYATPEPHEWILMAAATMMLLYWLGRERYDLHQLIRNSWRASLR